MQPMSESQVIANQMQILKNQNKNPRQSVPIRANQETIKKNQADHPQESRQPRHHHQEPEAILAAVKS